MFSQTVKILQVPRNCSLYSKMDAKAQEGQGAGAGDIYRENYQFWADRWDGGRTGWHLNKFNPTLVNNLERLTGGSPKTFFIPLCGKSLDMIYLLQQGHRVFGVEAVQKAIEDLNSENSLGLQFNPDESTYSSADGKLVIFYGDIFKCPVEKFGPFDCIWDRGSFIALEFKFRDEYTAMLKRALKGNQTFRYLFECVEYDKEKFGGPPRAVNPDDMQQYFGDWMNFEEVLRTQDDELVGKVAQVPGIGDVELVIYFMTPKA